MFIIIIYCSPRIIILQWPRLIAFHCLSSFCCWNFGREYFVKEEQWSCDQEFFVCPAFHVYNSKISSPRHTYTTPSGRTAPATTIFHQINDWTFRCSSYKTSIFHKEWAIDVLSQSKQYFSFCFLSIKDDQPYLAAFWLLPPFFLELHLEHVL